MRLRFSALNGHKCQWKIQRYKQKQISRTVTKQIWNSETQRYESKQETEYKSVQVLFTFNVGVFTLNEKGFKITLQYYDGYGSHYESGWGNFNWNNEYFCLNGSESIMINIQNEWQILRMNKWNIHMYQTKYNVSLQHVLNELYFLTMKFECIQEILYQSNPSLNVVIQYRKYNTTNFNISKGEIKMHYNV